MIDYKNVGKLKEFDVHTLACGCQMIMASPLRKDYEEGLYIIRKEIESRPIEEVTKVLFNIMEELIESLEED